MKVETSAGTYFIDWKHKPVDPVLDKVSHITECIIKTEDNEPMNIDLALCSIKDNFCRAIGRKISLARAMRYFDKSIRKEIWEAYLGERIK